MGLEWERKICFYFLQGCPSLWRKPTKSLLTFPSVTQQAKPTLMVSKASKHVIIGYIKYLQTCQQIIKKLHLLSFLILSFHFAKQTKYRERKTPLLIFGSHYSGKGVLNFMHPQVLKLFWQEEKICQKEERYKNLYTQNSNQFMCLIVVKIMSYDLEL